MSRITKINNFLKIATENNLKDYLGLSSGDTDRKTNGKVSALQRDLESFGYNLPRHGVDGIFGPETRAALKRLQEVNNLQTSGSVDDATASLLSSGNIRENPKEDTEGESSSRKGILKTISDSVSNIFKSDKKITHKGSDVSSIANQVGIDPVWLKAVLETESSGRSDVIRFEPHLFNMRMKNAGRSERVKHTPADPPKIIWSRIKSETDKGAFEKAFEIDPKAAVESTSWGTGQVLGKHLLAIEPDPKKAVESFYRDSKTMSAELIGRWFSNNPRAIRYANNKDFASFALKYNGPRALDSGYDKKLKANYERVLRQQASVA